MAPKYEKTETTNGVDLCVPFAEAVSLTCCDQGEGEAMRLVFSFTEQEGRAFHHHWQQQLHVLCPGCPWGHEH